MQQQLVLLFQAVPPVSSSGIVEAVSVALSAIAPSNQSVVSLTVALSNQFAFTGAQSDQFVALLTVTLSDQFLFTGVGLAALSAVELDQG